MLGLPRGLQVKAMTACRNKPFNCLRPLKSIREKIQFSLAAKARISNEELIFARRD
jgi:hypothetical protein